MKRLERVLEKGADKNLAILLIWDLLSSEEKKELTDELTFEEVQWVWENALPDSQEKTETWDLAVKKAEVFDHYRWIWENTLLDSQEKKEAWELAVKKAENFYHYLWIWKNSMPDSQEKIEAWELVEANADLPKDLWLIWRNFPEGSIKRAMALELFKMHDNFSCEFFLYEWSKNSAHDSKKNDVLKIFKARAKNESIEYLSYLWRDRSRSVQEREIIWESIKDNVNSFDDYYQLSQSYEPEFNDDFDYSQYTELLQKIKHQTRNYSDAIWVWDFTDPGTPERNEAIMIVMSQARTFHDWKFVWENLPPDSPKKSEALFLLKARSGRETSEEIHAKMIKSKII